MGAHGQGPYCHYPHGLSKAVATRFTQPYFGGGFHGHGGPAAYPGAFPGHPGLATGAPPNTPSHCHQRVGAMEGMERSMVQQAGHTLWSIMDTDQMAVVTG